LQTLTPAPPRLHDHFDSIQRISDTTTLPTLLPPLRSRLCALADVDALTRRLQEAASGASPLTSAEKVAVWEQLKVYSASWWPLPCCPATRACVVA
jgi:peroxin-3